MSSRERSEVVGIMLATMRAMRVSDICTRGVEHATRHVSVVEAARHMRRDHVGDVVVVDVIEGQQIPVGMLTDRDIVIAAVADENVKIQDLEIGDIMTLDPITVREDDDVKDALRRMQRGGVRRVPVVDAMGSLVGILSMDDVLVVLSEDLAGLSQLATHQARNERRARP